MLRLKVIRQNMTEVDIDEKTVLFSYNTAVAVWDRSRGARFITKQYYSRTTTRHINDWLDGSNAVVVPQSFIDEYIGG